MQNQEVDLLGLDEHLREVKEEGGHSTPSWGSFDGSILQHTDEGWVWVMHGGLREEPPEMHEPLGPIPRNIEFPQNIEWNIWINEDDDPELPF